MSGMQSNNTSILQFSEDISEATAPPPLPIGVYRGEIIGASWRTSPTSGNMYAQIMVRVPASEYAADYADVGEPDGVVMSFNRLLHQDSPRIRYAWRLFNEKVGAPNGRSIDLNNYLGLPITVDVVHQEYEGEQRASIARVLAP
jgi:hypothetical protein